MRGKALAAVLIAALSSCDPDAARAVELCSVVCECEAPAGASRDECIVECSSEVAADIDLIPAACISCITENRGRCLSIEFICEDVCDQGIDDEPPPPEPGDPPVLVDAGVDAF